MMKAVFICLIIFVHLATSGLILSRLKVRFKDKLKSDETEDEDRDKDQDIATESISTTLTADADEDNSSEETETENFIKPFSNSEILNDQGDDVVSDEDSGDVDDDVVISNDMLECRDVGKNERECQVYIKSTKPSLLRQYIKSLNLTYGSNDRPVTSRLSDIKSFLKRFGYFDYVKRLLFANFKDRLNAHLNRRKKKYKYRVTFGAILREDIRTMADVIRNAIKVFQKMMRLNITGTASLDTLKEMNLPRCGMKDNGEQKVSPTYMSIKDKMLNKTNSALSKYFNKHSRRKRHTIAGSRWTTFDLTYKITTYPTRFKDNKQLIDDVVEKAFSYWSDVTPLTFQRMPSHTPSRDVIIDVRFEKGEHGDGDPLDGVGKVLAHSYFPQYGGDAHFDDDEDWTIGSSSGSNLLLAAIHEFGHSLGLDHSDVDHSIMNPVYQALDPNKTLSLHLDDIRAIQILYGPKPGLKAVPNLCLNATIDAIYRDDTTSDIFVFKDKYFWKIKSSEMTIDSEYPKPIADRFAGIEGSIDDIIQLPDKSLMAFKGDEVYKYSTDFQLKEGYPKSSKLFGSFKGNLKGAVVIGNDVYTFKGNEYEKFKIEINAEGYDYDFVERAPIEKTWPGVPPDVNAIMDYDQVVYFFEDQSFYRFYMEDDVSRHSALPETHKQMVVRLPVQ